MRTATISMLIFVTCAALGCKSTGMLAKREAEKCCPTDIRKTVPWCAGEDAIFHCPCKPSCEFYGYKPTCWGTWPTSGAAWRDMHCGDQHHQAVIQNLTSQNPELITLPELQTIPAVPIQPTTPAIQDIEVDAQAEQEFEGIVPAEPAEEPEAIEEPEAVEEPETASNDDLPKPRFGPIRLPNIGPE